MTEDLTDLTDPEPWSHENIPLGIDAERIYRHAITIGGRRRRRRRQRYLVGSVALVLVAALPIVALVAPQSKQPRIGTSPRAVDDGAHGVTPDWSTVAALRAHRDGLSQDVLAIGDSVMLGAKDSLSRVIAGIFIDAKVSRRFDDASAVLAIYKNDGLLPPTVLVHLGANGAFSDAQFDQLMSAAGGRQVFFINAREPRTWETEVNQRLAADVKKYKNAHLLDWHKYGGPHGDWFVADGIHLTSAGARAYAEFIDSSVVTPAAACSATKDATNAANAVFFANSPTRRFATTFTQLTTATPPLLDVPGGVTVTPRRITGDGWTLTMAGGEATAPTLICNLG